MKSPTFGEGTVQSMAGAAVARILFEREGLLTMNTELAPLEVLDEDGELEVALRPAQLSSRALDAIQEDDWRQTSYGSEPNLDDPVLPSGAARGLPMPGDEIARLARAGRNALEIAAATGRGAESIRKFCKREGIRLAPSPRGGWNGTRRAAIQEAVKEESMAAKPNSHADEIRRFAAQGRSAAEISRETGMRPSAVHSWCRRNGVVLASGRRGPKPGANGNGGPAQRASRKPAANGNGRPDGTKKLGGVPIEDILADLRDQSAALAKAIEVIEKLR